MTEAWLAALSRQALTLTVTILVIAGLRPLLLKRAGAGMAYAAWLLVPALLMTAALPRTEQMPLQLVLVATTAREATAALPALPVLPAPQAPIGLAVWLAGAVLVGIAQFVRQRRLQRLGSKLPAGASPALVGIWRPRVALPADFEQRFSAGQRELILAHEDVHRDRHDNVWNLLACVLVALHWWNPLAWWGWRRMQADQELACDAAVLSKRPDTRDLYTHALLAAHGLSNHGAPLASRWTSTHPLLERIEMMNRPRPLTRRQAVALLATGLSVCGLAYATEAESRRYVEINLQLSLDGQPFMTPRLISELGAASSLNFDRDGDPLTAWQLKITVDQGAEGHLVATTEVQSGRPAQPLGGQHRQLDAEKGMQITLRRHDGGPDLVMQRQIRLLPADFKLPQ